MVWYSHLSKNFSEFVVIYIVKGFGIINKTEIDVFLDSFCFLCDPTDVGNLISGSSAFSKSSLKFMVHKLLKLDLENFDHYFASVWDECDRVIVWTFFGIAFLRDWKENWPFPALWPLPLKKGMANHFIILALKTPWTVCKGKDITLKDEFPRSVGAQYTTGEERRNNSRKNEEMEPKWKQHPIVDVTGDRSKVRCCKEQYCIGTWNVRSMNQGKLEVVKQEMARLNINILGISELKWAGMGKFNSDDHYIYYCGQESLRRNGAALIVNKRVWNEVLRCSLKSKKLKKKAIRNWRFHSLR